MKKRGFTLAEVLIAMAMVGVISALTMPTFISNSRNRSNAAKLASSVNAVESALQAMMASQAEDELSRTRFGRNMTAANLGEYLKLNGGADSLTDVGYSSNAPFRTISNAESNDYTYSPVFIAKNGTVIGIDPDNISRSDATVSTEGGSITSAIGYMLIDVNGSSMPNRWGRDAFLFVVGNDGMLYPAGSRNYSILVNGDSSDLHSSEDSGLACFGDNLTEGCTARLIEDNYEINY